MAWWTPDKLLTYNKTLNFVNGIRGGGKSFGMLERCVKWAIESGGKRQILYVRRNEVELKQLALSQRGTLFNDVMVKFPEYELKAKSGVFTYRHIDCDEPVIFGYAQAVSNGHLLRSNPMPLVETFFFDEFTIKPTARRNYLRNEVELVEDMLVTVNRPAGKKFKAWFIGNTLSVVNPYFSQYHIHYNPNAKNGVQVINNEIAVEWFMDTGVSELWKGQRLSSVLSDEYKSFAYENEFLLDSSKFIEQHGRNCEYRCTLSYDGVEMGLWMDNQKYKLYVSPKTERSLYNFANDAEHVGNGFMHASVLKGTSLYHLFTTFYYNGNMRYENQKMKKTFEEFLGFMGVKG